MKIIKTKELADRLYDDLTVQIMDQYPKIDVTKIYKSVGKDYELENRKDV